MKERYLFCCMVLGLLLALACMSAGAAISISGVGTYGSPTGSNEGLSGLCYTGSTQYYAVDDSGGVMQPAIISVNLTSGAISSASFGTTVTLGGSDLEGIGYNPANNSVCVSDETGATVKEYSLTDNSLLSTVAVPSIFASYRANYSLESLTIRGDGLEMWISNEEALYDTSPVVNDGPVSTDSVVGTMVRLQRFTRNSVHDGWTANGQWAYQTDPYDEPFFTSGYERCGVSDLCVLPEGTLLVLERELGSGGISPSYENRIFKVDFAGATDVSAITSLNGAIYTKVGKTQLWSGDFGDTYNFEGLCIGPRLNDGSLSMLMIADGDGDQDNGLYALKLSGLATRDLTVSSAYGTTEPSGGPYRHVSGTTVTNSVSGSPFFQGGHYYECTGWTATGHTPASGSGTNVILTLANDVDLTWNWSQVPNPGNILSYSETFESFAHGDAMPGSNGWTAASLTDALVSTNAALVSALAAYGEPCGYPVAAANHDKVLEVGGTTTNLFDTGANQVVWMDKMIQPVLGKLETDAAVLAGAQAGYSFNPVGHPAIWNQDLAGGTNRWTVLDDITITEGDWVRLSLKLDYQTDDPTNSVRYFQIRFDGILATNAAAWTLNNGTGAAGGSWFAMTSEPDRLNHISVARAALDDLVVTTNNPLERDVVVASAHGQADPAAGTHTYTYGDTVSLSLIDSATAEEGINQYVYDSWEIVGHAPASGTGTNVVVATLTNNMAFTWLWTTNNTLTAQGTPIWWLNSHGLAEADGLLDGDNDGVLSWQEWAADTDPTNSASVLQVTNIVVNGGGMQVYWQGGVLATQVLERCTNLLTVTDWTPVYTNTPPTATAVNFIDSGATNSAGFFRLKADR